MAEAELIGLPIELERVIFELAAWWYPETTQTLILVAKRVCIWIEPLLYQVVLSNGNPDRLLQMMQAKSPEFLRKHVHHLAFSSVIPRSEITRVLSTCTNIYDLALWTGDTYPGLLGDMGNLTHLRQLSVNLYALFGGHEEFNIPPPAELPFSHLTHLDVFSAVPEPLWSVFATLPALTHLSFSDYYIPELISAVLQTCEPLKLLIVVWTQDADPMWETPEIADPRFCMIACPQFENDWELGAWGGLDFWRRADDFVARKRNGEIEGSVFEA
ncbi:hypothetical protein DFH07DRAFT_141322 [Mycena maculata]|uniref:F-box domain-containing protein n=1 Tax=Mycena maculata TaxID=230809 RepID=A0AAD7I3B6_9AGAR|nr:hypothetical protein DFH07DRAFT_141322 [Mycena maculata]